MGCIVSYTGLVVDIDWLGAQFQPQGLFCQARYIDIYEKRLGVRYIWASWGMLRGYESFREATTTFGCQHIILLVPRANVWCGVSSVDTRVRQHAVASCVVISVRDGIISPNRQNEMKLK